MTDNLCPNGEYHPNVGEKTCLIWDKETCPYKNFSACHKYQRLTGKISEEYVNLVPKTNSA